jgi:hypothetical protein
MSTTEHPEMRTLLSLGAFLLALIGLPAFVTAQDKNEQTETGKIVVAKHVFKLQVGDAYEAVAEGKNFQPEVFVRGGDVGVMQPLVKFDAVSQNLRRLYLLPKKSGDCTLLVNYPTFGLNILDQPLDYKITLKRLTFAKTPALEKKDRLTATDPIYKDGGTNGPFKAYPITLKSGKFYLIDMVRKKTSALVNMDPYLYLEDPSAKNNFEKIVARDDDSGGDFNARILYQATKNGEFRIIASSLNTTPGEFTLTVREQE